MHNFIYFFTYINVNATHSNHFAWWISDSQRAQHKWLLSTYDKCTEDNLMGSLTKKKKKNSQIIFSEYLYPIGAIRFLLVNKYSQFAFCSMILEIT